MIQEVAPHVFQWQIFQGKVSAFFSGRNFPRDAHGDFLRKAGISGSVRTVTQRHTSEILHLKAGPHTSRIVADALYTHVPGIPLGILTADCLPVFFYAPEGWVGLAHAGWRGLHQRILSKLTLVWKEKHSIEPGGIVAAIGPGICKNCYEVGSEFKQYFQKHFTQTEDPAKGKADLPAAARAQLEEAGLRPENIFESRLCTVCHNDRFFSARKEKTQERMLSVFMMQP